MAEIGVDISGQRSKSVEPFLAERFDYVITLCDSAKESCPVMADAQEQLHWNLPDPAAAAGSDEEKMQAFRRVREDLTRRIDSLLAGIPDRFLAHMAAKTKIPGAPDG
jgi:arsenate reductase